MQESLEKYDSMPVGKAIVQNALPAVVAMLMIFWLEICKSMGIRQMIFRSLRWWEKTMEQRVR